MKIFLIVSYKPIKVISSVEYHLRENLSVKYHLVFANYGISLGYFKSETSFEVIVQSA